MWPQTSAFFCATPATRRLVSRLILESVKRNLRDLNLNTVDREQGYHQFLQITYPWILSIPLLFPNPGLVYASAPPNTTIELSTPLGLPWSTFSETNAQRLISSAIAGGIARRPSCDTCMWPGSLSVGRRLRSGKGGSLTRRCKSSSAVAMQAE